jgi:cell division protein FtsW (lipid II flippase)
MMQSSSAVAPAGERRGRLANWMPPLVEWLSVLAAIALLLPAFTRVADVGAGRERRYAPSALSFRGLPDPVLPAACSAVASMAEAPLGEALCGTIDSASAPPSDARLPPALSLAQERAAQAFLAPVREAEARKSGLRQQQQEGLGDSRDLVDARAATEEQIDAFVERFQLADAAAPGPLPLACALRWAQAAWAEPAALPADKPSQPMAKANAALLLAAALDGRAATASLARDAVLPPAPARAAPPCTTGAIAALSATAALMAEARQAESNSHKNEAMLALLPAAGWSWAGGMLLGFVFVLWSRHARSPALGVAGALAAWAFAAWLARVPWPLAGGRSFQPARLEPPLSSPPAGFVLWLAALAALLLLWVLVRGRASRSAAAAAGQAMSSRIGYAGLVLATGLGWLLLLDLSANGHPGNRYLALYHQGHLWLGMLVFSVLLFLRQPLARGLGWGLSIAGEAARQSARRLGAGRAVAALLLLSLAALMLLGLSLSHMRQLTSELGRVWVIVGAAWFFFLRAGPLAERLARSGTAGLSFWRYVWPLLFVVAVLLAAMLITRDMGPLLIAAYASGAFLAATLAMWGHQRSGGTAWAGVAANLLAMLLFAAWIGAITVALFSLGAVDSVTAARLESLAAPLASTNDQLALVSWFQRAAPPQGFGIGAVPWCGYSPAGHCSGVPAQIHSDYSFTAIVGVFGAMAAWAASLGCAVWLHRLIRHHGRVTRGEPRLMSSAGTLANDGQALLSWVAVAWVVLSLCQLAVTVAGNLAVLPLTGVTFPFVSFGMTSLLVNMAFLALCLNVNLPARGHDG